VYVGLKHYFLLRFAQRPGEDGMGSGGEGVTPCRDVDSPGGYQSGASYIRGSVVDIRTARCIACTLGCRHSHATFCVVAIVYCHCAGALREFLNGVLGPGDDITRFEYLKRNNRVSQCARPAASWRWGSPPSVIERMFLPCLSHSAHPLRVSHLRARPLPLPAPPCSRRRPARRWWGSSSATARTTRGCCRACGSAGSTTRRCAAVLARPRFGKPGSSRRAGGGMMIDGRLSPSVSSDLLSLYAPLLLICVAAHCCRAQVNKDDNLFGYLI
jgi:hypothetical protein